MLAVAAPALLAAESPTEALLSLELNLWIWTLIIFLSLLFILWKGGWKMMIAKLDARDEAIRGAIDKARREREEAERLLAEHREQLDQTRRETAEMLQAAQQDAQRERQKIVDGAREEYDRIVARGREQIEQETRAALAQVRSTVADLSLQVAGRLLEHSLDQPAQRELAERFAAELERRA
jgi:F-type H+-transporting ATPase subunit b